MIISDKIASELQVQARQVIAAITLLDEGATVPFISRYRKEVTGGLSDTQLRELENRLGYFRELEDRKQTILKSIEEQGKLTPKLKQSITETESKATLEDLYLPYKPKRRTKAQIAREAGLEPLATSLLENPTLTPATEAEKYLNPEKEIKTAADALEGAKQILMELFSENAELLGHFRDYLWEYGIIASKVAKDKEKEGIKFSDYFDYQEPIKKMPSHRTLAVFRGRKENFLRVNITLEEAEATHCIQKIAGAFNIELNDRPADQWLYDIAAWTWKIKLFTKLELELMMKLREQAEEEAINVFAQNLKHLLMAAPAGTRITLGLDPGLRTGVKVVVVDHTGKLLEHTTIFPHAPRNDWDQSMMVLAALCQKHKIELVSIGNGTASRETDKLVAELMKKFPQLNITKIMISEAGASVYSASELAAREFPNLDVSFRGAVSIARRLQDPLAELVKIEPKSIGVGQYQHDVNQSKLGKTLFGVMEDCVNAVGVDLNTASAPLLTSVAGLNETIANNIISYRDDHGGFKSRQELKQVPRLGEKTFEQAAGFLKIRQGENPLDNSAVHPEAYPVIERILAKTGKSLKEVLGNIQLLRQLKPADYTDEKFGVPTVTDIIQELEKPGRDPRPEFKTAEFKDGVEELKDLSAGMILEGVITNVTNFGAFVDIGVHQDGLVHKSQMANRFVTDPNEIVKVGDIVKVKVMEVDMDRRRVGLSMRLDEKAEPRGFSSSKGNGKRQNSYQQKPAPAMSGIMAQAFAKANATTSDS